MEGIGDGDSESDGSEEEEEAGPEVIYRWKHQFTPRDNMQPFTPRAHPGPTVQLEAERTALNFFQLLVTDEFLNYVILETDRYAQQQKTNFPDKHKANWVRPSLEEFKAFLGLVFLMGVDVRPETKMYWTTDINLEFPVFSRVMPRDRFLQILRYLHFVDNENPGLVTTRNAPGYNAVWKVQHVTSYLTTKFREAYVPKENISVDETMIPFKGRVHFRQYLKNKPTKWGIKAWAMAEATTGYMLGLNIYPGKSDKTEAGLTHKVVLDLLDQTNLGNLGHTIYMDNLYTSPRLLVDLYDNHGTKGCGTLRSNRKGLPKDIVAKKPLGLDGRGNYVFRYAEPLLAVTWQDKKAVHFLSTRHGTTSTTCQRTVRVNNKFERIEITQPVLASEYTANMGGVDRCDQYIQYYSFGRKTTKWPLRVFFKLLEMAKANSYTLHKQSPNHQPPPGKSHIGLLQFTLKLIAGLIGAYSNPNKRGRPRLMPVEPEVRLTARHFPTRLPNRSWCHVCWKRVAEGRQDSRKQTFFGCQECRKHLCNPECFTIYHTVADY